MPIHHMGYCSNADRLMQHKVHANLLMTCSNRWSQGYIAPSRTPACCPSAWQRLDAHLPAEQLPALQLLGAHAPPSLPSALHESAPIQHNYSMQAGGSAICWLPQFPMQGQQVWLHQVTDTSTCSLMAYVALFVMRNRVLKQLRQENFGQCS